MPGLCHLSGRSGGYVPFTLNASVILAGIPSNLSWLMIAGLREAHPADLRLRGSREADLRTNQLPQAALQQTWKLSTAPQFIGNVVGL